MDDLIRRQDAIEILNKLARDNFTLKDGFSFYLGALHDVSDGIEALPSAQLGRDINVLSTDTISRQDAIDAIEGESYDYVTVSHMKRIIKQLPSADRPTGKWIIDRAFGNDVLSNEQMVICSECGKGSFYGKQNYCPNCGSYNGGGA